MSLAQCAFAARLLRFFLDEGRIDAAVYEELMQGVRRCYLRASRRQLRRRGAAGTVRAATKWREVLCA